MTNHQEKESFSWQFIRRKKTYHTRANLGMIDVTEDFRAAVEAACRERHISCGTVTGFTTGGVAGLTTLEFEPGIVNHDLKGRAGRVFPLSGRAGRRGAPIGTTRPGTTTTARPISRPALLSPFITVPFVARGS
jgi:hypothetical protein